MAAALRQGKHSIDELYQLTRIDRWFLFKMKKIIDWGREMETMKEVSVSGGASVGVWGCGGVGVG